MSAGTVHELKYWPEFFQAILTGVKTFEIRKNDRDFKVGQTLWIREYEPCVDVFGYNPSVPGKYTGNFVLKTVVYITDFNQVEGFVVMGFTEAERA